MGKLTDFVVFRKQGKLYALVCSYEDIRDQVHNLDVVAYIASSSPQAAIEYVEQLLRD